MPSAYLGLSVPGFPNMFLLYGPNTNGGTGSVIYTIEAGMQHVLARARGARPRGRERIEVRPEAADAFDRELRGRARRARSGTRAAATGTSTPNGNDPNQWPYPFSTYRRRTAQLDRAAYSLT